MRVPRFENFNALAGSHTFSKLLSCLAFPLDYSNINGRYFCNSSLAFPGASVCTSCAKGKYSYVGTGCLDCVANYFQVLKTDNIPSL